MVRWLRATDALPNFSAPSRGRLLIHRTPPACRFFFFFFSLSFTEGHVKVVEELVLAGANVSEQNAGGETALHVAASANQAAVIRALAAASARRSAGCVSTVWYHPTCLMPNSR